jgi:D-lactate dehydrogenase
MKIKKVYADALTTLAKGTDAGIYRLNPKRVEIVSCEQDVKRVLAECEKTGKSVTFKAGGTSLSGQTISDSVLIEISPDYGKVKISGDGSLAKFPCGITGEEANRWLKPYARKRASFNSSAFCAACFRNPLLLKAMPQQSLLRFSG